MGMAGRGALFSQGPSYQHRPWRPPGVGTEEAWRGGVLGSSPSLAHKSSETRSLKLAGASRRPPGTGMSSPSSVYSGCPVAFRGPVGFLMALSAWLPLDPGTGLKRTTLEFLKSSLLTELGTVVCWQVLWSLPLHVTLGWPFPVQPLPGLPLSLHLPHGPKIADPAITNIQRKHFEGTG